MPRSNSSQTRDFHPTNRFCHPRRTARAEPARGARRHSHPCYVRSGVTYLLSSAAARWCCGDRPCSTRRRRSANSPGGERHSGFPISPDGRHEAAEKQAADAGCRRRHSVQEQRGLSPRRCCRCVPAQIAGVKHRGQMQQTVMPTDGRCKCRKKQDHPEGWPSDVMLLSHLNVGHPRGGHGSGEGEDAGPHPVVCSLQESKNLCILKM
jgi:hypothetical protein